MNDQSALQTRMVLGFHRWVCLVNHKLVEVDPASHYWACDSTRIIPQGLPGCAILPNASVYPPPAGQRTEQIMTTPMRQQYLSIKSQHPDCILLFRLGDFYETFDDDAKIVARVCDVVLTSRPVGNDQRVPLAGVPYHSIDGYVAKLVAAGYRVAIAEQVSEPGKGPGRARGASRRHQGHGGRAGDARRAAQQLPAGHRGWHARAYVGAGLLRHLHRRICRHPVDRRALLAEVEQRLGEELSRLQPSELITVGWQPEQSSLHGLVEALRPVTSSVEAWQVEPDTASASLKRHFNVSSLDGFGLQGRGDAVRAANAILAYVQAMQPSALSLLTRLHGYTSGEFMTLDEATRRNLELTETMRGGDAHGSLLGVLDDTRTPMGGRLLRRWLNQPLLDVNAINRRLDAVQLLHDNTVLRLDVREHLRHIGDLERWTNRAIQGIAQPRDLVGMREVLARVPGLNEVLGSWGLGVLGKTTPPHPTTPNPTPPRSQHPLTRSPHPPPPLHRRPRPPHRRARR
jgi:DNA mismatch repair protein MutS